jgi:hypothetical protein
MYTTHKLPSMGKKSVVLPDATVASMREWVMDCHWDDIDSTDVPQLFTHEVVSGVETHYAGGVAGFLADVYPHIKY